MNENLINPSPWEQVFYFPYYCIFGCVFTNVDFCLCGLLYNVTVTGLVQCNTHGFICLFRPVLFLLKKSQMMASDASHMLEAALEQMDDIIAGIIMLYFTPKCSEIQLCLCFSLLQFSCLLFNYHSEFAKFSGTRRFLWLNSCMKKM